MNNMTLYKVLLENLDDPILYHGTKKGANFDKLKTGIDGGIHLGSKAQAEMRGTGKVYKIKPKLEKTKRVKDTDGSWIPVIKKAKRQGYDSVVYLNRYEGLSTESIQKSRKLGYTHEKLERISDSQFKKLFPESEDSYIVFDSYDAKIIDENTINWNVLHTLQSTRNLDDAGYIDPSGKLLDLAEPFGRSLESSLGHDEILKSREDLTDLTGRYGYIYLEPANSLIHVGHVPYYSQIQPLIFYIDSLLSGSVTVTTEDPVFDGMKFKHFTSGTPGKAIVNELVNKLQYYNETGKVFTDV